MFESLIGRQLCEIWHRIKYGYWCDHATIVHDGWTMPIAGFTPWRMANMGANKYRRCVTCRRWEWV